MDNLLTNSATPSNYEDTGYENMDHNTMAHDPMNNTVNNMSHDPMNNTMGHETMNNMAMNNMAMDNSTMDTMAHGDGTHYEESEGNSPVMHTGQNMHDPVQTLINSTQHTHRAVNNGNWSDPETWQYGEIPGDGAKVLIEGGTVVTYDIESDSRLETVSIEGNLIFSTNQDTRLVVETILNGSSGQLDIGSEETAVAADKTAHIIFTSDSAVDTAWDPDQLSKGLVSHGVVNIYGAEKTDKIALQGDAAKGADVLRFQTVPEGWQIGDRIVLGGTGYNSQGSDLDNSRFQDEVLTITSIDGNEIRFTNEDITSGDNTVLRYDHIRSTLADSADELTLYAGNLTRNVSFETENGDEVPIDHRAHVMLMHNPNVAVVNAGFYDLGRSDKSEFVDDPDQNVDGSTGYGTNPRGRYSLHIHRTGVEDKAVILRGNAVEGSPGWGIVQHDSHAGLEDNVVFDVVGASIAAESGNETGWWTNNLTIKTTGIPLSEFNPQAYKREKLYDFGVEGSGYWVQGAAQVANKDNTAISANREGLALFGGSLNRDNAQDATTLKVSSLPLEIQALFPPGQAEVDIRDVPMATVEGFEAYNSTVGLAVWGHATNFNGELAFNTADPESAHQGRSLITDFQVWGNRFRGASVQYSSNIDLQDGLVLGNESGKLKAFGAGLLNNQASYGTQFDNITVAGFEVGADIALPNTDKEFISSTISNSTFSGNTYNLAEVGVPLDQGGYNDYAAYVKLENNEFEAVAGNQAPTAEFSIKALGGLALDLDASASRDADPLKGSNKNLGKLASNGIGAYGWDLDGDGTIDRYGRQITHVFDESGAKEISLTVWDSQGKATTIDQRVDVQPTAYGNAFSNGDFVSRDLQIAGNDNSQWADQGWFASKGVNVSAGAAKLSVKGDRSNYIGQVTRNNKVHQGTQTLSYDLKNIEGSKKYFDGNEITVTLWGVNGQFENSPSNQSGPAQVGTLPMERQQLSVQTFTQETDGFFNWKTITTEVDLGEGYDYLLYQVNSTRTNNSGDTVAIDNVSLSASAVSSGNGGTPTPPTPPTTPIDPTPPTTPIDPSFPSELEPVLRLTFDESQSQIAVDTSSGGQQNNGTLNNASRAAGYIGQGVGLTGGKSRVAVEDSEDINLGTHDERTISMWFKADDLFSGEQQVLFEEGGRLRGLNMYLDGDSLIFGGWSQKGGWDDGSWIQTDQIQADTWHHVALVLDGEGTLQPGAMTAYLDGQALDSVAGTQMWQHADGIGIGNTNGSTRFADGMIGRQNQHGLVGAIDEVQIYNDALTASQVQQLASVGLG